jgi:dUTP pyrophosphatase
MFNFLKPRPDVHVIVAKVAPKPYRSPKFTAVGHTANATKPTRAHDGDAGYDLTLVGPKPVVLNPGARATVPTGWAVRLDPATCGLILPRSGNASKLGLNVITGVVDAGYDGELKVTVHNTSRDKVVLTPGMRIAQLVVTPVVNHDAPAKDTKRGGRGFGSTDDTADMVNHPPHYTTHPVFTGECHDYATYMTFDQGNAFKYLWRCAAKGDMHENVRKALWYLNRITTVPVLDAKLVDRLEAEVTKAMDNTNKATAPAKYMAALACYSAAALVADGKIDNAIEVAEHALDRLNGVK